MLRSQENSGMYTLRAGGATLKKNAQTQITEVLPNPMLLHYVTGRLVSDGWLEIAMPGDERALGDAFDRTVLEKPPQAPFPDQTLEINGVMFWRRRPSLARLAHGLRRKLLKR
jgi:hypothetical protein